MANVSLQRFRKLTEDLQKECLEGARVELAAQADRLVALMKRVCPVNSDPPPRPGLLRDSIGWTFGDPPATSASGAFRPAKSKSTSDLIATVYAGNDEAFYARFVEFGTKAHSLAKGADVDTGKRQRRGRQHQGTVAQPFFYPSYRLLKKSMRSSVKRKLSSAIKKRSA